MTKRRRGKPRPIFVALRDREGLSQAGAAARGNVSAATIYRLENGIGRPQNEDRPKLAKAYGIGLAEFSRILDATDSPANEAPPTGDEPTGGETDTVDRELTEDMRTAGAFARRITLSFANDLALDELERAVIDLGRSYVPRPVAELTAEIRDVRTQTFELVERNRHPNQMRQLYLIACRPCGLQAHVALDFGNFLAAEAQARTAWLFADLAGHDGARGWIRAMQSLIAYWDGRFSEAVTLAQDGQRYGSSDSTAVRLPSLEARARAAMGDQRGTLAALTRADDARAKTVAERSELGGVYTFPEGKQAAYAGTARLALGDPTQLPHAVAESRRAIELYEHAPEKERSPGDLLAARLDLVTAYLDGGALDAAEVELETVLSTPSERRTASILKRARRLSGALASPRYRAAPLALAARERLELFCAPPTLSVLPISSR